MHDMTEAREAMVRDQLSHRGIHDARVLAAMREVPREAFLPEALAERAYDDGPLPIGAGQTISQPFIVALMLAAAELGPGDRVLEVGAGSGYAAAVMSRLTAQVYGLERHKPLTAEAARRLNRLGYSNVRLRTADGTRGWASAGPFDAILVAAAGPAPPEPLKAQLTVGGRLVMPVGEVGQVQRLIKVLRAEPDVYLREDLCPVGFVPLIGAYGWPTTVGRA